MYRPVLVCLMGLGVVAAAARCGTSVVEEQPALITEQSALAGTWQATGAMPQAKRYHAATVLGSGRVLVSGGWGSGFQASSVVYDPATRTWASTGSMAAARQAHVAVLLPTGKVLVAGGENSAGVIGTAEAYDPAAESWTGAGSLTQARAYAAATALPSGKVLVVGGSTSSGAQRTVDVYDPGPGTWSAGAQMLTPRRSHTVTVLGNGKVLVVGGWSGGATRAAELYDPAANSWSATSLLSTARYDHTATLLPSGKVLVVGGRINSSTAASSAELYDPATGTWSAAGTMAGARASHTATLVGSKVVVAGGDAGAWGTGLTSVEVYDAAAGTWTTTGSMIGARSLHVAALLNASNHVLVAGGAANSLLATAELYDAGAPPPPCNNTYYRDADGDGYGNPSVSTQACSAPAGYVTNSSDCNDANFGVKPGAAEACNGVDDNCNGSVDEGVATSTYYRDADGDGRGNPSVSTQACSAPAGWVSNSNDCNDADANLPRYFSQDSDGDGYGSIAVFGPAPYGCVPPAGYSYTSNDCNDGNPSVHPGAAEACNGVDDNCNGSVDEGAAGGTYYRDADGDGRGNPSVSTQACSAPAGWVSNSSDCNDADASLPRYFSQDSDGDGYGSIAVFGPAPYGCVPPAGYSYTSNDCNDGNPSVHPGAAEACNGVDDNCNGSVDEGMTSGTYYRDADGDGRGNPSVSTQACSASAGWVSNSNDCNDADANLPRYFSQDVDGDGYGDIAVFGPAPYGCVPPAGYSYTSNDCNDGNPSVHPGAAEVCNGVDDNCNGSVDEWPYCVSMRP
jgi:hypothetical protein